MSTAKKAATMDPNSLTTIVGAGGLSTVAIGIAIKLFSMFNVAKTDAATQQATTNILSELQEENSSLRVENNRLRDNVNSLIQEKFTFQLQLQSANDKLDRMTQEMSAMRLEMDSLRDTIRGIRNGQRDE
jgi:regulator of replication initiation timing